MDEKLMHKNQVLERDFQVSDGIAENVNHTQKVYGRDLLLQLRLHPLSLQKPKHLPGMAVIKEKLYLHDITNTSSSSNDKQGDSSNYHATPKTDYYSMKHDYQALAHYWNRMYPNYYGANVHDGVYSGSSKYRSCLHTYCKKNSANTHCYKDFPLDEYLWAKRCFATSEDMWSYQNFSKKKEHVEAVPKKKYLPIIDPVTGKNILETVTNTLQKQQNAANMVPENSELSDTVAVHSRAGEKYSGDYFFNNEVNNDSTLHFSNDASCKAMSSSESKMSDKLKSSSGDVDTDYSIKGLDNNLTSEDRVFDCESVPTASNKEENLPIDAKAKPLYTFEDIQVMRSKLANELQEHNMHANCDPSMALGKNANKMNQNRENNHSDMCDSIRSQQQNTTGQNEMMKESLQYIKDKICTLKQEQQRMNVFHSFLRCKKYQLEETGRNLDEKRIEMANWECNLYNKAKRLHEKELWLESKTEILYNKALQLAEKEASLSKKENKSSGDCTSSNIMSKENEFSENKPVFDSSADGLWDEISKKVKNSYKNGKSNDYSYFGYSSISKVGGDSSSHVEHCKSNSCSLDELEKDIVRIEKLHSSSEGGDGIVEKKRDLSPSSTMKKDQNDSLGYSKGKHYLPEHIKYWLNKRDNNAL